MDHFKMMASKNRAKARLDEMAAEEGNKTDTDEKKDVEENKDEGKEGGKKLKAREVHWNY